jgi:hypothetical protein
MSEKPIHQCECSVCQSKEANSVKDLHGLINFFLSTLDDNQRRLFVGMENLRRGPGCEKALSQIIGWTEVEIAVAGREVERAGFGTPVEAQEELSYQAKLARAIPISRSTNPPPSRSPYGK